MATCLFLGFRVLSVYREGFSSLLVLTFFFSIESSRKEVLQSFLLGSLRDTCSEMHQFICQTICCGTQPLSSPAAVYPDGPVHRVPSAGSQSWGAACLKQFSQLPSQLGVSVTSLFWGQETAGPQSFQVIKAFQVTLIYARSHNTMFPQAGWWIQCGCSSLL